MRAQSQWVLPLLLLLLLLCVPLLGRYLPEGARCSHVNFVFGTMQNAFTGGKKDLLVFGAFSS